MSQRIVRVRPLAGEGLGLDPSLLQYRPIALLLPFVGRDLVSLAPLTFSADAKIERDYFEFPGANGYVDFGTASAGIPHTVLVDCTIDSFPTSYPFMLCYKRTAASYNWELFFSDNASYSNLGHGYASASSCTKWSYASPAGKRIRLAIQVTSTSGGTSLAWINGAQVAASSGGSLGSSSGNNRLGQQSDSTSLDFDGRIWSVAIFDSLLPASFCERWTVDPSILFEQPLAVTTGESTAASYLPPHIYTSRARVIRASRW